jgi:hypothetical protein
MREKVDTDTGGVHMKGFRRNEKALLYRGMSGHT